jgi:hypothetical protein
MHKFIILFYQIKGIWKAKVKVHHERRGGTVKITKLETLVKDVSMWILYLDNMLKQ